MDVGSERMLGVRRIVRSFRDVNDEAVEPDFESVR